MSMAVGEAKHFPALTATTDPFVLKGGRYMLAVDIGDIDSVTLQVLLGAEWLTVPSEQTAAVVTGDGGGNLPMGTTDVDAVRTGHCAPGTYRLTVSGADTDPAAVAALVRIQ